MNNRDWREVVAPDGQEEIRPSATRKPIKVVGDDACPRCDGTGVRAYNTMTTNAGERCPTCGGAGKRENTAPVGRAADEVSKE